MRHELQDEILKAYEEAREKATEMDFDGSDNDYITGIKICNGYFKKVFRCLTGWSLSYSQAVFAFLKDESR